MNDTSTSPIIMGLFFVLRCLIPLGILLGISYLLRRLELVIDHAEEEKAIGEEKTAPEEKPQAGISEAPARVPPPSPRKKPKSGKKKPTTPKKRRHNK